MVLYYFAISKWNLQSLNGTQFLIITFLPILLVSAPAAAEFRTVIVPLQPYMHHYNT